MGILGTVAAMAAGLCGALLVTGYCIHFDSVRRSDPDFKTRLRERRRKQRAAREAAELAKIPDLKDPLAVQRFHLEELQLGEELLAQGDYEKGVDHMTNAIAVCPQPQQSILLKLMEQALPPPAFQRLLNKLPAVGQHIVGAQSRKQETTAKERAELSKPLDVTDAEAMQTFFLGELKLGRDLVAQGDCEKGVEHLSNAVALCAQPQQLLQLMQKCLPPSTIQMLLTKLPTISQTDHLMHVL